MTVGTPFRAVAALLILTAVTSSACRGDGDDGGGAPEISGLIYSPDAAVVGDTVLIEGEFAFTDDEGDVAFMAVELRPSGGVPQRAADVSVTGSAGVVDGTVPFQLTLQNLTAGSVEFALWLIDVEENESNELVGAVTILAP